jgi:FMN reductase
MTRRIVVVSAGLSSPSSTRLLGDRLGAATADALRRHGERVEVEVVELREHAVDLANHLVTGFASARLSEVIEQVTGADALVVVSPIFNASYSGLFKTFVDVLPMESLTGMPVLLAATGGTARHSLAIEHALRPLFAYLRTVTVPTGVFAATEDWASAGDLNRRIERAAGELADLVATRPSSTVVKDPYDLGVAGFAALLPAVDR